MTVVRIFNILLAQVMISKMKTQKFVYLTILVVSQLS